MRGGEFDEALANIASAKRLADNPERICGMVFGYDGTWPGPSTLNKWFRRPQATALAQTPRLGPTLFSFFQHGVLLLRLDYDNGVMVDWSNNYHALMHVSKINRIDEPVSEGWKLRYILANIYSMCSGREFQRTHMFQDNSEVRDLLNFAGGVPSADHFEFGRGFVARATS